MENKNMQLIPYLSFEGTCEEALSIYKRIFNGKVEIVSRYDNPAMKAPEEYKNKVLHARLSFRNYSIYASDVFPGHSSGKSGSNVSLSLSFADLDEAKRVYEQLIEGGKTKIPFEKQFWGDWHGNLTDRFGVQWMVNFEESVKFTGSR
jgi:PhnB protein